MIIHHIKAQDLNLLVEVFGQHSKDGYTIPMWLFYLQRTAICISDDEPPTSKPELIFHYVDRPARRRLKC